uniref:RING-type domain-containing protein n=2 Tax=Rhizophora mucronata TaxID=61149 RepID=A0A2P2IWY2_RHIMU
MTGNTMMQQPPEDHESPDHVINISDGGDVSSSESSNVNSLNGLESPHHENGRVSNGQASVAQNSQSFSDGSDVDTLALFKALLSVMIACKMILIISSIIVLVESRHEKPRYPLFAWIASYAAGCALSLPVTCQLYFFSHPRLRKLLDQLNWLLEFFFVFWLVLGNFWVFGEKSPHEAYTLYRFSLMLLIVNYIRYGWPLILHAMLLCCCRRLTQIGGASAESINALPTYRFKLQNNGSEGGEFDGNANEFGVVAVGTEKERALSSNDAICCICLASYDDNDELKELPCSHLFHASCVDKWLKIKALCPLCKCSVGKDIKESSSAPNSS